MHGNKIARFDSTTQKFTEWDLPPGARPHGLLVDEKGVVWYTGNGTTGELDPAASKVLRTIEMPAGANGGPYAMTVDGAGRVWANEIQTDTVAVLDPTSGKSRVIGLPTKGAGIRKAVIDAQGRYWYMGSHNGRLGVVE